MRVQKQAQRGKGKPSYFFDGIRRVNWGFLCLFELNSVNSCVEFGDSMDTKGRLVAGSHNRNEFVLINADEVGRVSFFKSPNFPYGFLSFFCLDSDLNFSFLDEKLHLFLINFCRWLTCISNVANNYKKIAIVA